MAVTPETDFDPNAKQVMYRQPDYSYRLGDETVMGHVDGMEAIRQSVRHILDTERYSYPIYSDMYGVELQQYAGKDFEFIEAGIEETIRDALLQDDRIAEVNVTAVTKTGVDTCKVEFEVGTIYGVYDDSLDMEF